MKTTLKDYIIESLKIIESFGGGDTSDDDLLLSLIHI